MTSIAVIENKISAIRRYLQILAGYAPYPQTKIENDVTLRGAVERYLYLAAQAAIDLAEAIIAYKDLRKPTTFSESFEILEEAGILPRELTQRLVKMAGFRNVIAHDYEDVDFGLVYAALTEDVGDIGALIEAVGVFGSESSE